MKIYRYGRPPGAEIYSAASNSWQQAGALQEPRFQHTATLLPDGRVLVTGGQPVGLVGPGMRISDAVESTLHALSSVEVLDPRSATWSMAAPMSEGRAGHTATLLSDGRVLVVGGFRDLPDGFLASVELYNPREDRWTPAAPMTQPRVGHTATPLQDGRVLVAGVARRGGLPLFMPTRVQAIVTDTSLTFYPPTDDTALQQLAFYVLGTQETAEIYDPAANRWSSVASMRGARVGHTATLLPDGRVLVLGGAAPSGHFESAAELYDPSTEDWTAVGRLSDPRVSHTATLLPDGRVLVLGGLGYVGGGMAELFDPATWQWSTGHRLEQARAGHAATLLPDGRLLVTGGRGVLAERPDKNRLDVMVMSTLKLAERYDPSEDRPAKAVDGAAPGASPGP